jgi:antitoxin ParD1/3/4
MATAFVEQKMWHNRNMDDEPMMQDAEARLAALDTALVRGVADANARRVKPASEVFDRLEAKYKSQAKDEAR